MLTTVAYRSTSGVGDVLLGEPEPRPSFHIEPAVDRADYYRLRTQAFVHRQGLFADDRDDDPRTMVLVARNTEGAVLGGVRLGPIDGGPDLGWWFGGRLVVDSRAQVHGVGGALVRARLRARGKRRRVTFRGHRAGPQRGVLPPAGLDVGPPGHRGRHPTHADALADRRIATLVAATKAELGALLAGLGPAGYIGDDGAPVPGSDVVAACDAILPSMVERDPEWAGWCAVLVNVNDLAAMGATPVGLLDALGARDSSFASRVLAGLRRASQAYGVPVLGGHTQLGVPAALSVTALGRAADPIRGGGGRPGHRLRLTVDTAGGWRPGYAARQWDSTSHRRTPELRAMLGSVAAGMLAEASGCAAVLDVAAVPRPATATVGDWFTCFPGFGMLTADEPGRPPPPAAPALSAECGELVAGRGGGAALAGRGADRSDHRRGDGLGTA